MYLCTYKRNAIKPISFFLYFYNFLKERTYFIFPVFINFTIYYTTLLAKTAFILFLHSLKERCIQSFNTVNAQSRFVVYPVTKFKLIKITSRYKRSRVKIRYKKPYVSSDTNCLINFPLETSTTKSL